LVKILVDKNSLILSLNIQKTLMFFKAIGIMSGTSLDGLDVVLCDFFQDNDSNSFKLVTGETFDFPKELRKELYNGRLLSGFKLCSLDLELGSFIGSCVNAFLKTNQIQKKEIDFIASHGHTIFHQPEKRITCQIGSGQEIARITQILTINNFREKDVIFGGQGAPLVPVGDRDLFKREFKTEAFVNLGGFANVTHITADSIQAFDISPCNLVLNRYARLLGYSFDKGGELGRIAKLKHPYLVDSLNALPYFHLKAPKSLGAEWLEQVFYKLLDIDELSAQDKLGICYEVISDQIAKVFNVLKIKSALFTGGGAKNDYLIELIQSKCETQIVVPKKEIIDFKEAIVFAYLGVLYMQGQANCLKDVTSASKSVVGGVLYRP
jgi:anhydro-N-acetylmuramic acid kinase